MELPETVAENYRRENCAYERAPREDDYRANRRRERDYEREDDYKVERRRERRDERRDDYERDEDEYFQEERRSKKKHLHKGGWFSGVPFVFVILLFPVWFPLLMVIFALALSLTIVAVALTIVFAAVCIALVAGGIYAIVMSFGLFAGNIGIAVAQIGAGLALIGVGILLGFLFVKLIQLIFSLIGALMHHSRRERSSRIRLKPVFCGTAFLLVGAIAFMASFASLDFKWQNLTLAGEENTVVKELTLEETLTVKGDNLALSIEPTDGTARIEYKEVEGFEKTCSYEDGVLTYSDRNSVDGKSFLKETWTKGIFHQLTRRISDSAVLYLPVTYHGALTVEAGNGALALYSLTLDTVKVSTENGAISLHDCTFGDTEIHTGNGAVAFSNCVFTQLTAHTDNGLSTLKGVTASVLIQADTDNGAIKVDRVTAPSLTLITDNGAITGTVSGSASDYQITAHTSNGKNNLDNTTTGEKILNVRTENGLISISFTE